MLSFPAFAWRKLVFRSAFVGLSFISALAVQAQDALELRELEATPLSGTINIDGRLDEPVWETAAAATNFIQFEPETGAPATQNIRVQVIYGHTAVYIGAEIEDDPELVRRTLSRRDAVGDADWFSVSIDGMSRGREAYVFTVTAAGGQADAVNELGYYDYSWDAIWESAAQLTATGWSVEMAIPYSQLRFPQRELQHWLIQFERYTSRTGELAMWQPVTRDDLEIGFIGGRLSGIQGISPRTNIQIRPYALTRLTRTPIEDGYDNEISYDVGVDLKVGITSNIIFDATINPDFGQVESDPAVLNLSAFETFFSERRPFFIEGTSIFDYVFGPGDGLLLYTRRIGTLGRIVGAGKLTGRLDSGISFGVMTAITSDGFETPEEFTGNDFQADLLYASGRIKQEFGNRSSIGLATTYFDGRNGDFVWDHYQSLAVGADWDIRMRNGTYRYEGMITTSHRWFAPELETTPQSGFGLFAALGKVRGYTKGQVGIRAFSDQFEPNDVGFLRDNDYTRVHGEIQHILNSGDPIGPFNLVEVAIGGIQSWTFREHINLGSVVQYFIWSRLRNYHLLYIRGNVLGIGGVDVRESRGFGPVDNDTSVGLTVDYSTDTRKPFTLNPILSGAVHNSGGTAAAAQVRASWRVNSQLSLSLSSRYEHFDGIRAWAAGESFRVLPDGAGIGGQPNAAPGDQQDFHDLPPSSGLDNLFSDLTPYFTGQEAVYYYAAVFGARDHRSLDLSLRANYVLRPNLSLQLYSQLFAAKFHYDDFSVLVDPSDLRPFPEYPRQRAEARNSLNLNAVVRWEYRPGSTLFLVWTHSRFGIDGGYLPQYVSETPYDQSTIGIMRDTFELRPVNIFLVKLNYLLMR